MPRPKKVQTGKGTTPAEPAMKSRRGRKSTPIQVANEVAEMIKVIVAHDGGTEADFVTPILREDVTLAYKRVLRQMGERIERLDEPRPSH